MGTSFSTALSFSQAFVDVITGQVLDDSYALQVSKSGYSFDYEVREITDEYVSFDVTWTGDDHSHLFDLEFVRNGETGSPIASIPVSITASYVELVEEDDFHTVYSDTFTLSSGTVALAIEFNDLVFNTLTSGETNDAFELALVDANGDSVVGTVWQGRDAFFNFTQGAAVPTTGGGATVTTDATSGVSTVTVDVSHLSAGTEVTLLARLINNDANVGVDDDVTTAVVIAPVMKQLTTSPIGSPTLNTPVETDNLTSTSSPESLTEVTALVSVEYGMTSYNADTSTLYSAVKLTNEASQILRGPVLVGISNITDSSVSLLNYDGQLSGGIQYYEVGHLITGDVWEPAELLSGFSLQFSNPNEVEFDYDLTVYAALNSAPVFTSTPNLQITTGDTFTYDADATDADGDVITYSLETNTSPSGMTIDSETGEISWDTSSISAGDYTFSVVATDSYGGTDEQNLIINVQEPLPNRPPVFDSIPVVDAYAGFDYLYLAHASDLDGDTLTYAVTSGPTGLTINSSNGLVQWQSVSDNLTGQNVPVTITASDGNGGVVEQNFLIAVHADLGNTPPIIITTPNTEYVLPDGTTSTALGDVSPTSIDLELELGDGTIQPITLNYPDGDSLFTADVVIALDSSGSMENRVEWIPQMVQDLEAALVARGITNNRYSVVRFTGSSLLYATAPNPSRVSIYGPDNQLVDTVFVPSINLGWAYVGDLNLPATGDYYAIVENENGTETGEYRFEAELVQDTSESFDLTMNEVYHEEVDAWNESHDYSFTLAGATRVELDVLETFAYYNWSLEGPSGLNINNQDLQIGQTVLDLAAGNYTLSITSERFEFIPYEFRLNDLTNNITTITPGTP
ncbi:MAG: Ig domain-containing protein [Planctomycetaceae bacterium]